MAEKVQIRDQVYELRRILPGNNLSKRAAFRVPRLHIARARQSLTLVNTKPKTRQLGNATMLIDGLIWPL